MIKERLDFNYIKNRLQECLSVDLLHRKYKNTISTTDHISTGHCYILAEATYHILKKQKIKTFPHVTSFVENNNKMTHWWLVTKCGKILDPSSEQFDNKFDYTLGRRCGFLTKTPSKRCSKLIERYYHGQKPTK